MSEKQFIRCPYCNIVETGEGCGLETVHHKIDGKALICCCDKLKRKNT